MRLLFQIGYLQVRLLFKGGFYLSAAYNTSETNFQLKKTIFFEKLRDFTSISFAWEVMFLFLRPLIQLVFLVRKYLISNYHIGTFSL